MHRAISESKDVNVYKHLLRVLGDYCKKFVATGVDELLSKAIDKGKSVIPSDKLGQAIIAKLLENESVGAAVQALLNMRFSDLPIELRPVYKDKEGTQCRVAMWTADDVVGDKVLSLLRFDKDAKNGKWTDKDGESVELVDMMKEEK